VRHGCRPHERELLATIADFYLLERLWADGNKAAAKKLQKFEEETAEELATYLDMAVGGELRHMRAHFGWNSEDDCSCNWCDNCGDLFPYGEYCDRCDPWGENPGRWRYSYDRRGNWIRKPNQDYEKPGDCICSCCSCVDDRESADCWDVVTSGVREFLDQTAYKGRSGGWNLWMEMRAEQGLSLLHGAVQALKEPGWNSSFGGKMWATCAQVLLDYRTGVLSRRLFLDRCWTLQHNNGCVFNKLYLVDYRMYHLLEAQAKDNYSALVEHASPEVVHLWKNEEYRMLAQKRAGRSEEWLGVQFVGEVDA